MSDDWKNEDDIKAELRQLTNQLRTLRHELRNMVAPRKQNPSRAFLHRHSWLPPPATAADKPRKPDARGRKKR